MNQSFFKKATPHLIALAIILVVLYAYFTPLFSGKVLKQYDVLQWKSTYQEIAKFEKASGERTFWTNSIFGGMPSYLIGPTYFGNFSASILGHFQLIFKHPADTIVLLFGCFYILLLTFEVSPWLAIMGALAFMLSSFNFLNIDTGHITKGNAIAFIPLVLAGIQLTLHKNKWLGAIITGIAVSFELAAGHIQITYYLILIILFWMIVELVQAIKNRTLPHFLTAAALMLLTSGIAVGTGITGLLATEEYGKYSIRGKSDLTKTITGETNEANTSSGLDMDYAFAWSNGVAEPLTLLIPNFYGGSSAESVLSDKKSETLKALQSSNDPRTANQLAQYFTTQYWGDQSYTAGPIYYGAIIVFLFILGMFVIRGPVKWWIFGAAMLAILLSMGRNFMPLSKLFFDYFPLYNKFRSVTFTLCVSQTLFPLMAVLAIKTIMDGSYNKEELKKKLFYSIAIAGGLCLIFLLVPGLFLSFTSERESNPQYNLPDWFLTALASDRASLLKADALRSLVFILLSFGAIWFFIQQKIKANVLILIVTLLVTIDLWGIDKRYLNDKDFERKRGDVAVDKTAVDEQILADPDIHYRVYNNTTDFDKDAITAYYHKSLGGYHGAKMRRYQELIEWQLTKQNMECYNMLNTKYFIVQDSTGNKFVQRNPFNNGNAWFVRDIKWVKDADEEITSLTGFKSKETAVIDKRFDAELKGFTPSFDSNASIKLTHYQPNKLDYEYEASGPQLAVFSEIYYNKGWNAYVDGALVPYVRADYVLRAMQLPAGKHKLEYKFEPTVIKTGETISYASSITLWGGLAVILGLLFLRRKKDEPAKTETKP